MVWNLSLQTRQLILLQRRGLRAILENAVMDIMYETPSDETIKECIVNEDVINGLADPELVYNSVIGKKKAKKNKDKTA